MALWGNKDFVYGDGTIAVNLDTKKIVGTATTFSTAGISTGNVVTVGSGATFGYAIVSAVDSNTVLSIFDTDNFVSGVTTVAAGAAYYITEEPIYAHGDSKYDAPQAKAGGAGINTVTTDIFGIDAAEAGVARSTAYEVAHQGWVGVQTYTDMHGNLRVKSETLVAMGIANDLDEDDTQYADS
tara:strand:- start:77 stop:625 length:549 start_codon:yes stop_codon:yes gene_type:complete